MLDGMVVLYREREMDGLLVMTFRDKAAAREGVTALRELNGQGAIQLDRLAMIAIQADGALTMEHEEDDFPPPSRTLAGTAAGGLIGLLAGPRGFAVGAGVGGLIGLMGDVRTTRADKELLSDVAKTLAPGVFAIVVEASELIVNAVDERIRALGGAVFRSPHLPR
jgi:uncharacterized membrane protein